MPGEEAGSRSVVRRIGDVDADAWDAFVATSPDAWMHHSRGYLDAIAKWPDHEDRSFALLDEDRIIAVVPLRLERFRVGRILPLRRLTSQGGPALAEGLDPSQRDAAIEAIREHLRKEADATNALEVHLFFDALAPSVLASSQRVGIPWEGEAIATSSRILDLRAGPSAIWDAADKRARNGVRKAEREGVRVRQGGLDDLEAYYALHARTYERTSLRPHPRTYFEAMLRGVHARGAGALFVADIAGEPVAAANLLHGKRGAVYWTGASDRRGLDTSANLLLQWHMIQWAHAAGIELYEVGEVAPEDAPEKIKALDRFKRSFGGEAQPAPRVMWVARPLAAAGLTRARQLLRGVRR